MSDETKKWIEEVKERIAKATKGPWFATYFKNDDNEPIDRVWTVGPDAEDVNWETDAGHPGYGILKADAVFSASARTDLPRALEIIEELEKEIELSDELIRERDRVLDAFPCPKHGKCVPHALEQIEEQESKIEKASKALRGLIDRLDLIHEDPVYKGVWVNYQVHGNTYTGPMYVDELAKARQALKEMGEGNFK